MMCIKRAFKTVKKKQVTWKVDYDQRVSSHHCLWSEGEAYQTVESGDPLTTRVIPLGKGFYEFSFASLEDLRSVWLVGNWNLQPWSLRLSQWSSNFNPNKVRQTHAQCWKRVHEFSQEYWDLQLLFEIVGAVGSPITLDEATKSKTFGHFSCILMDVDLAKTLHLEVMVERESYAFLVKVNYENFFPFVMSAKLLDTTSCSAKGGI